ncbi:hypothetical protein A2853_03950 [Candidatus Kaiserbacteria bacterium RIFCSPHIGHO2_01_FULL_55_17]|uniref:Uncharacterized protein n=1 Tax=Candidatus Kaiserbacteria bacterium RIFCSPHIGHO2_01_FULL_55_17 TaxID=1798484 RepID=A0A1F6D7R3_9BACT|nr:MAG: hypothetical protein A2853_03950 [Candidatus Kaiserbacteria bacterium RIFCSPHIGHO2_01_FULL_55_17]
MTTLPIPNGPATLVNLILLSAYANAFVKACNEGLIKEADIKPLYIHGLRESRELIKLLPE